MRTAKLATVIALALMIIVGPNAAAQFTDSASAAGVAQSAPAAQAARSAPVAGSASRAASKALAVPSVRVMPGDRTITVAWQKVSGATGYHVRYSTSKSMTNAKAKSTKTGLSLAITKLRNKTSYYVQVVAVDSGSKNNRSSKVLTARPEAGYPRLLKVTAKPAGLNKIRVSWTGQKRATKVAVIAGSEGSLRQHPFNSKFYPATTTSVTVTVPAKHRAYLGSGSGNPIFIKVATYNSHSARSSLPRTKSVGAAYRLSLAGTFTYAGHASPEGPTIRIAEWNVHSVAASKRLSGHTWKDRRKKVAAGIVKSGASLVATAELTTANAGLGNGVRQWEDLAKLLKPKGYRIATDPGTAGKNATNGAHLFYQPKDMTRLGGGLISPKSLGIGWPAGLIDRYASWAQFQLTSDGTIFYAVAVHLPANSKTTSYRHLRVAEARAIDKFISKKAGMHTVVMAGDFNSTFLTTDVDPAAALHSRGYYDASATAHRSNARIATSNITRQVNNKKIKGYPTKPYFYKYPAPRIDYILLKNSPGSTRYVNQVIAKGGVFNRSYQGSDHNLQWADVVVRKPASGWLLCGDGCR